jgi:DNA-directed RNA polymerase subunit RPC12/RpoP
MQNMNKKQIETVKSKLSNRNCPVCKGRILLYSNPLVPISQISSPIEQSFFDEIDISKDNIKIECRHCGYIMFFKKEILLR